MGKRLFSYNLLNPTTDIAYLQDEYDITEHLFDKYSSYDFLKQQLTTIKDISKISRQVFLKKITPKSLHCLYNNLQSIKGLFEFIQEDEYFKMYLKNKIAGLSNIPLYCDEISCFINNNVVIDTCKDIDSFSNFEIDFIKNGVDLELDVKMKLLNDNNDKLETIRQYFNKILSKFEKTKKPNLQNSPKNMGADDLAKQGTDYVKIHETEKNSFSLIATKRRCEILKKELSGFDNKSIVMQYASSTDGSHNNIVFTLPVEFHTQSSTNDFITNVKISQICKNISSTKIIMKDLITKAYIKIITEFEQFNDKLNTIIEFITILDLIYAKASIAKRYNYCKPTIDSSSLLEKSFVNTTHLRHCLIEHIQQHELYVSNDIQLGKSDVDGVLLYGLNMSGKTTFIKSIGIAVIMAQAGLFVPASSFTYYPYKYIFTRILNNDNLFKGMSTFAVEMCELRTILRIANDKSLILGDELCSGTESISAISIFVASLMELYNKMSSFIFATHMHEIVKYDEIVSMKRLKIFHLEVFYDKAEDILIYDRKLKLGSGSSTYGLEVAKFLKLPNEFLESANNIRMKYNPETASILSLKQSSYNSKKLVTLCERCRLDSGTEIHHIHHQSESNEDDIIVVNNGEYSFHKNHKANLLSVCEKCHKEIHVNDNYTIDEFSDISSNSSHSSNLRRQKSRK
jgi:DNA mismatch repair protein MutS